ncbi:MAG: hypothetical protein MOB07_27405 [Acidobacteria bacterium]|nr:hypothetical protein [Acidobacteriota bacterium]
MKITVIVLTALTFISCGNSNTPDRALVLKLVKDQRAPFIFELGEKHANLLDPQRLPLLRSLAEQGVLTCDIHGTVSVESCNPGPKWRVPVRNERESSIGGFFIGYIAPTKVTGISMLGENAAEAKVVYSLEPDKEGMKFFDEYRSLFVSFYPDFESFLVNGKEATIKLKLYDDGWRLEDEPKPR